MEMGGKLSRVEGLLHTLLEFCQRNSISVEERERQVRKREKKEEKILYNTPHFDQAMYFSITV